MLGELEPWPCYSVGLGFRVPLLRKAPWWPEQRGKGSTCPRTRLRLFSGPKLVSLRVHVPEKPMHGAQSIHIGSTLRPKYILQEYMDP